MNKRKILLVTTVPDTFIAILDGQPGYLNNFFNVVLASSDDGRLVEFGSRQGVSTASVPMVRGINPLSDLKSIYCMVCLLREMRPEIIHSYTPKAGLVSMVSAWICRVPVRVHTFTGLIFPTQTGFKRSLLIWTDRLICFCATKVVPEGQGVLADLRQSRITNKRLKVVGHGNIAGVDTAYFSPKAENVAKQADAFVDRFKLSGFVFCFVGRLNRDKGVRQLVQAFARLPKEVSLLLVGGDDPESPVDAETQEVMLQSENIYRLGFLSDIRPVLLASDVLVLPSYREGFPNVVLQAGAMCLPVIATDISGCNEVITPGFNGWLVPPRDASALFDAMNAALDTPKERLVEMGERGRERVKQRFERAEHWARMRAFYEELGS